MEMKTKLSILLALFLLACTDGKQKVAVEEGPQAAPEMILSELDGRPIDLSSYCGKAVFVNVWATWCKPCIQEMPTIQNAQNAFKEKNIVFLLASNEETELIQKFAERRTYDFHYARLENLEELGIQALPTTFIFNPDGKLKFSESGSRIGAMQQALN